jgi:DNA-directed RNA polymerase subunit omega
MPPRLSVACPLGSNPTIPMRDDYLLKAREVISDPYILVNVVSTRVKQLRRGSRPLVESLEKLTPEDTALREIGEGKIGYELPTQAVAFTSSAPSRSRSPAPVLLQTPR